MYLKSLKLKNFRCFRDAAFDLVVPGETAETVGGLSNVTLFYGENGAGKTSVLRGIALSLLSPMLARNSGFVAYSLVRRTPAKTEKKATLEASVTWHEEDDVTRPPAALTTAIASRSQDRFDELVPSNPTLAKALGADGPGFVVVGYGATRRVEGGRRGLRDPKAQLSRVAPRFERVAGLFEESRPMVALDTWLGDYTKKNPGRAKQTRALIDALLADVHCKIHEIDDDGTVSFFRHSERGDDVVPFDAMSDGFRAYVGWIADLLYHVNDAIWTGAKLAELRGIVLVDEVDLHLHPRWQRRVIPLLATVLPRVQFVFTSHSPLVAASLSSANIRRITVDPKGGQRIEPIHDELFGKNAEQVLASELFELESSRAPAFVEVLEQVARDAAKGDSEAALRLSKLLARGAAGDPKYVERTLAKPTTSRPRNARAVRATKGRAKRT